MSACNESGTSLQADTSIGEKRAKSIFFPLLLSVVTRQYGQANLIFHSQNTGDEHGYSAYHLTAVRLHAGKFAKPIHRTAHHTRHRVNLLTEYERYLVDKDIAYHAARRSGNAAHDDGHPKRIAQRKALAHAHHRKQRQTDCSKAVLLHTEE